ncbi:MAG: hypothetical protein ABI647_09445 [Gemmatimonadota bacterium]
MSLLRTLGHAVFALLFGVLFSGVLVLLAVETVVRRRFSRGGIGGVLLWEELDADLPGWRVKTRPTVPEAAGFAAQSARNRPTRLIRPGEVFPNATSPRNVLGLW